MDLQKKVIIVTGGCGLLGSAFIRSIIENNGVAIAADINKESGEKLRAELISQGYNRGHFDFIELSITSKESILNLIHTINTKYGKIDALVNNAHPRNDNYLKKLEEATYEGFCENLNNHVGGFFLCMQQFSAYFQKQGHGNIISLGSIYGVMAPRFEIYYEADFSMPVEYAAIKSGIIHLTKYFAKYYKGKNIRFNCISPGGVFNNQHSSFVSKYNQHGMSKGLLNQEDLCGTLIFLLSDQSKMINGQNIIVDDGWSL